MSWSPSMLSETTVSLSGVSSRKIWERVWEASYGSSLTWDCCEALVTKAAQAEVSMADRLQQVRDEGKESVSYTGSTQANRRCFYHFAPPLLQRQQQQHSAEGASFCLTQP
jgi:hypothetical protein